MDGEAVIAILLGAALAIFSLVIAGYPIMRDAFFRPAEQAEDGVAAPSTPDAAGVGAESIYDAIETLELDYQLGNLPEAEYRRQLQAYRVEAAEVIRAQLERGLPSDTGDAADDAGPELRLEREVMAWRRPESRADASESLPSANTAAACPECDAPIPAAWRGPCPGCGAARR